jgi:CO/xanthine dehydrogenase FAD-binding subunit
VSNCGLLAASKIDEKGDLVSILNNFGYVKPKSISEAIRLLSKYKKASILAGGTDIIGNIKEEIERPEVLIDIKGLTTLKKIRLDSGNLQIGALVTFTEIMESAIIKKKFPVIAEVAKTVGSVGIRNRATLIGNICSAVPCMDSGPMLCAYDATVIVQGPRGKRKIPIAEWFCRPRKTSLKKGELVTGIIIPLPKKKHAGCYVKLGRYSGEDLAQASIMVLALSDGTIRVAFGSVGPVPIRAYCIEELLNGEIVDDDLIEKVKNLILEVIFPITDIRATKEYRMHMCKIMFERGIKTAIDRLDGKGIEYGISVI